MNDCARETPAQVPDAEQDDCVDAELMKQALTHKPTPEKLMKLQRTKPAPASWFDEDFNRPTS